MAVHLAPPVIGARASRIVTVHGTRTFHGTSQHCDRAPLFKAAALNDRIACCL